MGNFAVNKLAMDTLFSLDKINDLILEFAPRVLGALLTLIIGFWIASRLSLMLGASMDRKQLDPTIKPFFVSLVNIGLKVLVVLSAASMFGLQVTSFIAILSAAAFAIGLALQGTLGHLASGVLILIFKPYRVGDFIVTSGHSGVVKEIQLFNTILTTLDNLIIIFPNGAITGSALENLTVTGERKLDLTFGIGYGDNIDKARSVIESVIAQCPGYLHDKGHDIFVKNLGNSSVDFAVRFWVETPNYWSAFFFMQENIKKAFDREGVNIPFPQMDVHVKQN